MNLQAMEAELYKLDRQRQKIADQIQRARSEELRALPQKYGFASIAELIAALRKVTAVVTRKERPAKGSAKTAAARGSSRNRYPDAVKKSVREALERDDKSARQIASDSKVSLATVNLWKKTWGLTRARKKRATAAKKK